MSEANGSPTERRYITAELTDLGKKVAGIEAELKHYAKSGDIPDLQQYATKAELYKEVAATWKSYTLFIGAAAVSAIGAIATAIIRFWPTG